MYTQINLINPASVLFRALMLVSATVFAGQAVSATEYQLVGTLEGDKTVARAIFENPINKEQKYYKVGDKVDGAILIEIGHRKILLQRGDITEQISLTGGTPMKSILGRKQATHEAIPVVSSKTQQNTPVATSTQGPIAIPKDIDDPIKAMNHVLSQTVPPYKSEVIKIPLMLQEYQQLTAHFRSHIKQGGQLISTPIGPGLEVSRMDSETRTGLGLRDDDVLVAVNGMGFDNQKRFSEIALMMTSIKPRVFDLVVIRDKAAQPLIYEVSGIYQ